MVAELSRGTIGLNSEAKAQIYICFVERHRSHKASLSSDGRHPLLLVLPTISQWPLCSGVKGMISTPIEVKKHPEDRNKLHLVLLVFLL